MLGVDFVINALLETSGLRWGGACARVPPEETTNETIATKKKLVGFTPLILLCRVERESVKHPAYSFLEASPCGRHALRTAKRLQHRALTAAPSSNSVPLRPAIAALNADAHPWQSPAARSAPPFP